MHKEMVQKEMLEKNILNNKLEILEEKFKIIKKIVEKNDGEINRYKETEKQLEIENKKLKEDINQKDIEKEQIINDIILENNTSSYMMLLEKEKQIESFINDKIDSDDRHDLLVKECSKECSDLQLKFDDLQVR